MLGLWWGQAVRNQRLIFLSLDPGPAALGFTTISVTFCCAGCGFQPVVSSAQPRSGYIVPIRRRWQRLLIAYLRSIFSLFPMNRTLILFGAATYQAKNIHLPYFLLARYRYKSQFWPMRWKKNYTGALWEILT